MEQEATSINIYNYVLMGRYLSSGSPKLVKRHSYCLREQFSSFEMIVPGKDVLTKGLSVCEALMYLES